MAVGTDARHHRVVSKIETSPGGVPTPIPAPSGLISIVDRLEAARESVLELAVHPRSEDERIRIDRELRSISLELAARCAVACA